MIDFGTVKDNLTNEQVISILCSLGSDSYRIADDETFIFKTICHNHNPSDASFKLYYYSESKIFHCYTQCGDSFDIYELIQRNKKCTFYEAFNYVCEHIGFKVKHSFGESTKKLDDWDILNRYSKKPKKEKEIVLEPYNNNVLNVFMDSYYSGWIQDGMSIESMKKYGIRYDVIRNSVIIPHYSLDSQLVGIRRRSLNPHEVDNGFKYMPLKIESEEYSHPLMFNLYGLNYNIEAIKRAQKILIFEGEKSVILCDTYYGENNFTIACCGSNISNWQRDIILSLGVKEVIVGFDKEFEVLDSEDAMKYEMKIAKITQKFTKYCQVYVLWDTEGLLEKKDSPTDKGKDILEKLMKNKIEVTTEI